MRVRAKRGERNARIRPDSAACGNLRWSQAERAGVEARPADAHHAQKWGHCQETHDEENTMSNWVHGKE